MSKMIQIRNVPDEVHRRLADRPSLAQMRARLLRRGRVASPVPAAELVREARGES